jgi:hypothetical protein
MDERQNGKKTKTRSNKANLIEKLKMYSGAPEGLTVSAPSVCIFAYLYGICKDTNF